eukprot:TRINITY_DN2208_c0_g1_i10.p1 TRINITY_DN2208_c0_g1~~TRINITY_DN2208_c0_g1_i10.p1  ORF type:complete len:102 (+),score=29.70 TRINITY_DN2208_c0_g1_i10:117-422(+)
MIRRPPRSTLSSSSAASDVYKRQLQGSEQLGAQGGGLEADVHQGVEGGRAILTILLVVDVGILVLCGDLLGSGELLVETELVQKTTGAQQASAVGLSLIHI